MNLRILLIASLIISGSPAIGQKRASDTLLVIKKNASQGFYHDYLLFVPKGTAQHAKTFLLVEPNNTGILSDSIAVHEKAAIALATVSSVGNNISTELDLPLLVPIFPRPASDSLLYTHALDRDMMLLKSGDLKRIDLQLLAMIEDARKQLEKINIKVYPKIFMNGFSASGTFTNRFSFLHPDKIQALAIGGFNGKLMLPISEIKGQALEYPLGLKDFRKRFKKPFDISTYSSIPQFIYLGKLDDNDAVQYDDAYNNKERNLINNYISDKVQERFLACQAIYRQHHINPVFKSYEKVGHWTTSEVNLDVIRFFQQQVKAGESTYSK
jgi:hypothetical protein